MHDVIHSSMHSLRFISYLGLFLDKSPISLQCVLKRGQSTFPYIKNFKIILPPPQRSNNTQAEKFILKKKKGNAKAIHSDYALLSRIFAPIKILPRIVITRNISPHLFLSCMCGTHQTIPYRAPYPALRYRNHTNVCTF